MSASGSAPPGYDESLSAVDRKRTGAWFTPPDLVAQVAARTVGTVRAGSVVRVLDPACGDGRFLFAAAELIRAAGATAVLTGVDIDLGGLRGSGRIATVEAIEDDALAHEWGERRFDVVIGNPPFLSQ